MPGKANLLVVMDYNRKDFLDLLRCCRKDFNLYFIEHASPKEIKNHYYKEYGQLLFWKDYSDAFDLLDKIKPTKVIFLFIESYYHVILNLTCKAVEVPTYHLDHGVRDLNVNVRLEPYFKHRKKPSHLQTGLKRFYQLRDRIKTRLFLIRTLHKLPHAYTKFAKQFIRIRKKNTFLDTYRALSSPLRLADAYISYSFKIFETHKTLDALPDTKPNYVIGIPNFDHLANLPEVAINCRSILFIDQGFADEELLGWNNAIHEAFVNEFCRICSDFGFKIYVKPHPRQTDSSTSIWLRNSNAVLVDNDALMLQLPHTQLIISFFSSYLLPIISYAHTTVLTLENHPIGRIDVSKSFIEAGVAHPVYTMQDLEWALQHIEQLHQKQLPHKAKFTEEWMYKFDGKAGERLRDILLSDTL